MKHKINKNPVRLMHEKLKENIENAISKIPIIQIQTLMLLEKKNGLVFTLFMVSGTLLSNRFSSGFWLITQ